MYKSQALRLERESARGGAKAADPSSSSPPLRTRIVLDHLADAAETRVFVGAFGGYADAKRLRREASALARRLEEDGVEVAASAYFFAGYDSPFRPIGRHNEVWLKPSDAE